MKRGNLFLSLVLVSVLFISSCAEGDISGDVVKMNPISVGTSGQPEILFLDITARDFEYCHKFSEETEPYYTDIGQNMIIVISSGGIDVAQIKVPNIYENSIQVSYWTYLNPQFIDEVVEVGDYNVVDNIFMFYNINTNYLSCEDSGYLTCLDWNEDEVCKTDCESDDGYYSGSTTELFLCYSGEKGDLNLDTEINVLDLISLVQSILP